MVFFVHNFTYRFSYLSRVRYFNNILIPKLINALECLDKHLLSVWNSSKL